MCLSKNKKPMKGDTIAIHIVNHVFKQKQKTNGGRHYRNLHCFEMKATMLSSHALVYIKGDHFLFGSVFIKKK